MVKKISAIILALALCLSVAVIPTTAAGFDSDYQFAEGIGTAFKLELDKQYYNPGDIVTVSVYARFADESREVKGGTLMFGVNSAQFDVTDSFNKEISTATANATWESYWKSPASTQFAWQSNQNIINRVLGACTTDAGVYDKLLKVSLAQDANKALDMTHGLPAADLNADPDPLLTFQLKLRNDLPEGTQIKIGIPTGAVFAVPAQVTLQFFLNPGVASTARADAASTYDITDTVPQASIGTPAPAGPVVAKSKAEVKMTPNSPTTVEDAFQFRVTSVITDADWDTYFANTAAGGNNAITKLGFVAYKGTDGFDLETAKSVAKGGTVAGYDKAETTYVQKADDSSDAYFGAIIQITSAETRSDATYIAYVEYTDAEGATQYAFYDAAQTALLDTNYQTIVESYLAAYPFAG